MIRSLFTIVPYDSGIRNLLFCPMDRRSIQDMKNRDRSRSDKRHCMRAFTLRTYINHTVMPARISESMKNDPASDLRRMPPSGFLLTTVTILPLSMQMPESTFLSSGSTKIHLIVYLPAAALLSFCIVVLLSAEGELRCSRDKILSPCRQISRCRLYRKAHPGISCPASVLCRSSRCPLGARLLQGLIRLSSICSSDSNIQSLRCVSQL